MVTKDNISLEQSILRIAHAQLQLSNMQTALTVAILVKDYLMVGHVGNCRLYRVRNNHIDLLTKDHTIANDLLQSHVVSPEEAWQHPGRYQLTRSVGAKPFLHIDLTREEMVKGDSYLLCSDGLWANVLHDDIAIVVQRSDTGTACEELIELALRAGAQDDVTAIVFRVISVPAKRPAPSFSWRGVPAGK